MTDAPNPSAAKTEPVACPFCGGKAHVLTGMVEFIDAEVTCTECAATGANQNDGATQEENAAAAIAAWNARTHPQPLLSVGLDSGPAVGRLSALLSTEYLTGDAPIPGLGAVSWNDLRSLLALAAPAEGWQPIEALTDAHRDGRWIAVLNKFMTINAVRWDAEISKFADEPKGWVDKRGFRSDTIIEYPGNLFCELPAAPTGETGA